MAKTKVIFITTSLLFISLITFFRTQYLYTTLVDDAYIFFRYAENFVNGNGLVWNHGENPIEGYTSFLYLFTLIIGNILSLDLELFSLLIGILSGVLTIFLTFQVYQVINQKLIKENIFTAVLIGLTPVFLYWVSSGMETSFYSMMLLYTVFVFLYYPKSALSTNNIFLISFLKGILFGLLCVVRFEAILFFLISIIYMLIEKAPGTQIRLSKSTIVFILGFLILFGTYFTWRWIYFENFLPNTFYAKTGGGLTQVWNGVLYSFYSLKALYGLGWIVIVLILFFVRPKCFNRKIIYLFSLGLTALITTIILGGDHFYPGRFILPSLPFLFVIFPPALDKFLNLNYLSKFSSHYVLPILILLICSTLIFKLPYQQATKGIKNIISGKYKSATIYNQQINDFIPEWQHGWIMMGKKLRSIADSSDQIAAIPIGALAYYSGIRVIDMVGVVDPVIAHSELPTEIKNWIPGHTKGNGKYILSKKPEYIQLIDYLTEKPHPIPDKLSLQFKSRAEIWSSEEFHTNYNFFPVKVENRWYYNLYKRKYYSSND